MNKTNVKRILAVGGMGTLDADEEGDDLLMSRPGYPSQFLAVGKEHYKAYEFLKTSLLQWTLVCAPDIVDADATGIYYTAKDHLPVPNNFKINSGDLAMFMLNELEKNNFLMTRVGISN